MAICTCKLAVLLAIACFVRGTEAQLSLSLIPPMPDWAIMEPLVTINRNRSFTYNRGLVSQANSSGTVFDVLFLGDSLTGLMVLDQSSAAVWAEYWGPASGLKAARLGVGGSTVEELTWRLMANGEKPAQDPRLAVLLIGINNQLSTYPWEKLDFLLRWMGAAMPRTKVLVLAPLPSVLGKSGTLLQQYRPVVQRCPRCAFSTCGSTLDYTSSTLFSDGLHLTQAGYRVLYDCLKPTVLSLLKAV